MRPAAIISHTLKVMDNSLDLSQNACDDENCDIPAPHCHIDPDKANTDAKSD